MNQHIKVYIWIPTGKNVGHSALELPDVSGTYISWWLTQSPPDVRIKKLLRHTCTIIQYPFLYFASDPNDDGKSSGSCISTTYTKALTLLGCQRYKDNSNLKNWAIGNSFTTNNLLQDVHTERGVWPVVYYVPVTKDVRVDKMLDWWRDNNSGTFRIIGNNCCNKVVGALRAGGVTLRTDCLSMWKPSTLAASLDEYYNEQMEPLESPESMEESESEELDSITIVDEQPKLTDCLLSNRSHSTHV